MPSLVLGIFHDLLADLVLRLDRLLAIVAGSVKWEYAQKLALSMLEWKSARQRRVCAVLAGVPQL